MLDATFMAYYGFAVTGERGVSPLSYVKTDPDGTLWEVTSIDGVTLPDEGDACLLWHYPTSDSRNDPSIEPWTLANVGEVIRAIREIRLTA